MEAGDHLRLAGDKKALKALASNSAGNGRVLFSAKMVKINRKGKGQNRVLLITTRHLLNLMPDNYSKCNRCMQINSLHHISLARQAQEFVLHFTDEYDYRFKSQFATQAVETCAKAYETLMGGTALSVVEVDDVDALAQQVMTKVAVKKVGSSWGPNPMSSKLNDGPAVPPFSPSGRHDADDADSDDDGGPSELSARAAATEGGHSSSAPADVVARGAFEGKSKYGIDDFTVVKVLGKGAFGKVMLVKAKDSGTIYAMKALNKLTLIEKNEVVHTKTERKALSDTHHPFLVHLRFAFQSPSKLYLVMDYCNGGELFYHLKTAGRFDERRARLYAAEIGSALHHLHSLKIIYRDLKPENVLLDHEGHVRITDFGLAKDSMDLDAKTNTFCGTPDYLAPEIIKGEGHGRAVDWWSLGTMIYEMLGGLPPFYSENFNIMYERILRAPLEFRPPEVFSADARALITGMLEKQPTNRLGSSEADGLELKKHPWFASIDWAKLDRREIIPPFKPNVTSELDTSNFDEEFTSQSTEETFVGELPKASASKAAAAFEGFTYVDKGQGFNLS